MAKLQARRDRHTRNEIYEAAVFLFGKQGLTKTTMAQIAEKAEVSRRTVYRHFPSKDDIAFELPRQWLERFNEVAHEDGSTKSAKERCRHGVVEVARLIQSDRDRVDKAYAILVAGEELVPRRSASNRAWLEAYRGLLSEDLEPGDTESAIRNSAMAGALMGGTDGALYIWLHDENSDLVAMTEEIWEVAQQILSGS